MRTRHRLVGVAVLAGLVAVSALAQAKDPLVGTWKLNVEKSKTQMKSGTSVFEADGADGVKGSVDMVGADGTAYHWTFSAKYDGKDYPVTGKNPYGDTLAMTRKGTNTVVINVKQGGKPTVLQTIVVAADGKTRTNTTKGVDPAGNKVEAVSFYEKQ